MSNNPDILTQGLLDSLVSSPLLNNYRKKISNRKPHTLLGNLVSLKGSIYQGIVKQRSRGWKPTARQDEELTKACAEYLGNLYRLVSTSKTSSKFSYKLIGGTPTKFSAIVYGEGNVEAHIKKLRSDSGLSKLSNTIKTLFGSSNKNVALDLGHLQESTIAAQVATDMLIRFESQGNIPVSVEALEKLKATIKYSPLKAKLATIRVEDQFWLTNQSSTEEALILKLLRDSVGSFLDKEAANLVTPRINNEINNFLLVNKKATRKGKKLPVDKGGTSSKSASIKHTSVGSGSTTATMNTIPNLGSQNTNWASLLSIINARLPEVVKNNMGLPGLVNRTGRFAESTSVTGVEISSVGNPTIVYDYQKSPYGVFEPSSGSTLATPARDPKVVISKSIREIVQQLAVGRFYTRRAL